jgi:predicted metal-dependent phosphoesterase TrpH
MKANLHLHSRCSDGSDWPAEVARRAARASLELVALTDHDCLAGWPSFAAEAEKLGLRSLPAVEIDVRAADIAYRSELLAYFPHSSPRRTASFLEVQVRRRRERLVGFLEICCRRFDRSDLELGELLRLKIATGWRDAVARAPDAASAASAATADQAAPASATSRDGSVPPEAISLNKVDLFRYLLHRGLLPADMSYPAFRKAFFASGHIPDVGHPRATAEEAIAAVREDGGILVLPHPGHEFDDDPAVLEAERARLARLLDWCREAGVDGVELYWYGPRATEPINALVRREAEARGLFLSYGSDCHGPGSGKETMGAFSGEFEAFPLRPAALEPG